MDSYTIGDGLVVGSANMIYDYDIESSRQPNNSIRLGTSIKVEYNPMFSALCSVIIGLPIPLLTIILTIVLHDDIKCSAFIDIDVWLIVYSINGIVSVILIWLCLYFTNTPNHSINTKICMIRIFLLHAIFIIGWIVIGYVIFFKECSSDSLPSGIKDLMWTILTLCTLIHLISGVFMCFQRK